MMKSFHILNGDCLAETFPKIKEGEVIVWREALVDGPLQKENFFKVREQFIAENYTIQNTEYHNKIIAEFLKIQNIAEDSPIYFWFEDDLFCQINFWFLVSVLKDKNMTLFRVFPKDENTGFAYFSKLEFDELISGAKKISKKEQDLIAMLWEQYQSSRKFLAYHSEIVRNLQELSRVNENRFNGKLLSELKNLRSENENFKNLFQAFKQKFPILGFGDLQVKKLLESI